MERKYQSDCIFLFDDVFTDEECDYLIQITNKYAIKNREVYGFAANVMADSINSVEISDPDNKKKVCDLTFEKAINLCKKFKQIYNIDMIGFSTPTLRKIKGATKRHIDGVVLAEKICNGMCSASELRNMAIVVALNGDYEGGEFCFPEQGRVVKLKKGQAIAFPPYWTHPHYTNELLENTVRYTMNLWTHDKIV